ncbi:hypothetical protein [Cyanobium sp. NIES-981]|uniref:hypothetical protein n=1 Tax=Cyanobium sp. NIES-981 TaxID=1851505 RepID=UPI0007DD8717|nr:hypothetical protein [Cyanobium sp. NIES-981]SBO42934.1 conserved protein of unknown function [Cyanobium sp. NIES-981]
MDLPRLLPASQRRDRIGAAAATAVRDHWVTLHDGARTVPAALLAQELLVYRVDNGRLLADLEEQHGDDPARLRRLHAEEDHPDTQAMLHGLLLTKAGDARGPILQELRRLAVQTEPLLVEADGVVINGNRRLAAMRSLLAEDPHRYARFHEPLVAILPPEVSRADLEFLEASLQMAPETKLAYGWVERRLKLREQHQRLGLADDWIQEAYRLGDPAQLERELAELALAEAYLETFRGQPRRYSSLGDAESLFAGLTAQLQVLPPRLQAAWRQLGFLLIDQRRELDDGLAKHFPFSAPVAPSLPVEALLRLVQDWGLGAEQAADEGDGAATPPVRTLPKAWLRGLARRAAVPTERRRRALAVQELLDTLRVQLRQEQSPQRLFTALRQSRKLLSRLDSDQLTPQERNRLRGELAAIAAQGSQLLAEAHQPGTSRQADGAAWLLLKRLQARVRRRLTSAGGRGAGEPRAGDTRRG